MFRWGSNEKGSVCDRLVDFYGKGKEVSFVEMFFHEVNENNVIMWRLIMVVHVQNDVEEMVLKRLDEISSYI